MIEYLQWFTVPHAYALLPARMKNRSATAMLYAIAMQESGCFHRRQAGVGPARGFWQFERSGVAGVMVHPSTKQHVAHALDELCYGEFLGDVGAVYTRIEDNDVLACVLARLLLWTMPGRLAGKDDPEGAWHIYERAWRPGRPRRETWDAHFTDAWMRVDADAQEGSD